MGEFFHGWRRKLGLLTLLMACVSMVGWLRSHARFDFLSIRCLDRFQWFILSREGVTWANVIPIDAAELRKRHWSAGPPQKYFLRYHSCKSFQDSPIFIGGALRKEKNFWFRKFLGFKAGKGQSNYLGKYFGGYLTVPYWSIVMPLTLISTFLLLSKTRQAEKEETSPDRSVLRRSSDDFVSFVFSKLP